MTSSDQEISVHQIFGRNLRELCKRTGRIAEVADHLGVNRVQMNRILTGESFPKPGLMKRICDHFSVNARILLEPLAELEAEKRHQGRGDVRGMSGPFDYAFFGRDYSVNEENVNREIVPDGLHLMIRPSFNWRDGYLIGMVRFFNKDGAQVMRGFDPIARGMKRSDLMPMKVREYRVLLLNSSESISFLYATRIPNTVIDIDHFGTRKWPTHGFLSGRCLVMSSANPIGKTVVPSILQPLGQDTKTILEAARLCGFRNLSEVPRKYHEHLSSGGI